MPHLTTARGLTWHYEVEGEGPVLLFIHGWGVNLRIWRQQIKHFAPFYRVVSLDLPGHGETSWQRVTLSDIAQDVNTILETAKCEQARIVASSLGGLVALKLFDLSPQKVFCLVFVGSQPKFARSDDYPYGLEVEKIHKLATQLEADYQLMVNVFFRSLFTRQERETRRFKWIQTFRKADTIPDKVASLEFLQMLEKEDLRAILSRVHLPVQFINGTEDHICPPQLFKDLQQRMPSAQFDWFEQCGHFPFLSKPHEFNLVLEKFLNRLKT